MLFYLVHNAGFQSSVVFWVGVTVQSERAPGARHIDLTKAKLYPYLQKLHGAEVCPSYNYRSSLWRQKFDQITYGYGYNIYGLTTNNIGKKPTELRDASRIICFADAAQVNTIQPPGILEQSDDRGILLHRIFKLSIPTTHFRHTGFANVLFVMGMSLRCRWRPARSIRTCRPPKSED